MCVYPVFTLALMVFTLGWAGRLGRNSFINCLCQSNTWCCRLDVVAFVPPNWLRSLTWPKTELSWAFSQPDSGVKVSHVEASHVVAAATECKCCHAHETPIQSWAYCIIVMFLSMPNQCRSVQRGCN